MTFTKVVTHHNTPDTGHRDNPAPRRPRFDAKNTADRLRAGSSLPSFSMVSRISKGRKSAFKELGLGEDAEQPTDESSVSLDEKMSGERQFGEITGLILVDRLTSPSTGSKRRDPEDSTTSKGKLRWFSKLAPGKRPKVKPAASSPPPAFASLHRVSMIAFLIAVVLPAISFTRGDQKVEMSGADAGVIREVSLHRRADSPVDVCKRWAQQSALLNGTIYIYGGEAKTSADQTTNTWNNNFLTLDVTKTWDVSSPAISGLPQPSGPPAVALGYLWNDYNNLYLYGGEFSDSPTVAPVAVGTWQYDIGAQKWNEFSDPQTSSGNYSEPSGQSIQRAAEGAGISVPELGRSWYFGGHLDWSTTPGWSYMIPRIYLKSLLEFTHPGYSNDAVDDLHSSGAPDGGSYRNITEGGIQNSSGFSERADGCLVFVPGWGTDGILLGLGGGTVDNSETSDTFSSMQTIDVYDIASSTWYQQQISGTAPTVRVNPCAVVFSAPDASSFNIYMYGGQNLLPVKGQTQYTDMWILTIPAFTWVKVDIDNSTGTEPVARAGHTCHARDGQLVVIGGYIGTSIPCESPGIFSFNASGLQWQTSFQAADHKDDLDPDNSVLAGSYGYQVPEVVQKIIGGSSAGGATVTAPSSSATGGPFATGKPPVFTITQSGSTATITSWGPGKTGSGGTSSGGGSSGSTGSNSGNSSDGGLIAAAVIAGVVGALACYLGFCAWLWRRQVRAYKRHMALANQYHGPVNFGIGAGIREKMRRNRRGSTGSDGVGEQFGWVGQQQPLQEPKWASSSDEATPGSGSGGGGTKRPSDERNPWWNWFQSVSTPGSGGVDRSKSGASRSTTSGSSTDGLLDGREPNFFSVVMGPRRALRVVNGMEEVEGRLSNESERSREERRDMLGEPVREEEVL